MSKVVIINLLNLFLVIIFIVSVSAQQRINECYDPNLVSISTHLIKNEKVGIVSMSRKNGNIKAHYISGGLLDSAYKKYLDWSENRNIVTTLSANYIDINQGPVGLTIETGKPINLALSPSMDGLVIIYPDGGLVIFNLRDSNIKLYGIDGARVGNLNIKESAWDNTRFVQNAIKEKLTVFQTHLVVYRNKLLLAKDNSSKNLAHRRFLAIGLDKDKNINHLIIDYPYNYTLYAGANNILKILNTILETNVISMINLESGHENIFEVQNKDCEINSQMHGTFPLNNAANLLVYYYENN